LSVVRLFISRRAAMSVTFVLRRSSVVRLFISRKADMSSTNVGLRSRAVRLGNVPKADISTSSISVDSSVIESGGGRRRRMDMLSSGMGPSLRSCKTPFASLSDQPCVVRTNLGS
jgi:hypothetical protein